MSGGEKGFLLMEVLVALAVFLVVVTPVTTLLVLGVETQGRARRYTEAVFLAGEALEEVRSSGYCAAVCGGGNVSGFERVVTVTAAGAGGCGSLKEVTVTVAWDERGGRQEVKLNSCLGRR